MIVWLALAVLLLFGLTAFVGAPYVPSKNGDVARALDELYVLGDNDMLVDIGSGDGRVLLLAAKRGAKAVGYEINPLLVAVSRLRLRRYPEAKVYCANFWQAKLPKETTVVYTFGDSRDIKKMAQKVAKTATELQKPVYFISYAFTVPEIRPIKQVGPHLLYRFEPLQMGVA